MNKIQVKQLFLIINNCYPNFSTDDIKVEIWFDLLKDFPFEKAQENLRDHIKSSQYVPTPHNIIRHDPNQFVDHEQQKIDTQKRIADMSVSVPAITTERMEEIRRDVAAGKYDEMFKDDPYLGKRGKIGD